MNSLQAGQKKNKVANKIEGRSGNIIEWGEGSDITSFKGY